MKRVAVLGGGPAGAMAAERIARAGLETIVLDEKLAWEKPCGGALTYKACEQYPFLMQNATPKRLVREAVIAAPKAGTATLRLDRPLLLYSRFDLNGLLLERAERAGARIQKERVLGLERAGGGWRVTTRGGVLETDFCIVAMGARNPLRDVGTEWTPADMMMALGYRTPGDQEHIEIQFLDSLEGYIWVFPRCGHLSVGICGKGESAQHLRCRLERYMSEKGIPVEGGRFYGHVLPSLECAAWRRNRVAGAGWLAVGDAAGLVDPITGEGLYYALRSGDLAAGVVLSQSHPMEEKPRAYRRLLHQDFTRDLEMGAGIAKRFYRGRFLLGGVPQRAVQFMRHSPLFRAIMQDIFAGSQAYHNLKPRLWKNLTGTLRELAMSWTGGSARVK